MSTFWSPDPLPVSAVGAERVARIAGTATLLEVADALTAAGVGALVVGDRGEAVGIVSERDLVRALADRRDPEATTADEIAQRRLVWCDAGAPVAEVAELMMEHYVRHVLLEAGGRLVGIVSARDLLGVYAAGSAAPAAES
jgi:CBS domain-containing protein